MTNTYDAGTIQDTWPADLHDAAYGTSFVHGHATGPNSSTVTTAFDAYTRPTSSTSPHGAVTNYTYDNPARTTTATTNGRWTRTTTDGFGRTIKVETGYGATTVSTVDTEYDSCGCSPLGKVKRTSLPYAPGGTVYWTVYSYDCLGRTLTVTPPGNSGATTYVYEGNSVTVTSPAGKWKKYSTDALGNLVQVTEPDPSLGNVQTNYTYNLRDQLTVVSMPRGGNTQTRTFAIDLPTGRLTSAANPENGTVSYTYNADGSVATKTDAKNQVEAYTYDAFGRTTQITRTANGQERVCERVNLYYDLNPFDGAFTQNGWGRLTAVQYGCPSAQFIEDYSYTSAGLATKKRQLNILSGYPNLYDLQADYTYDNEGRTVSLTYPAEWGCVDESGFTFCPRPVFTYSYDAMGRPVALNQTAPDARGVASDVLYNAAGQITQMKTWSGGYRLETRQYNVLQQLTRLTMLFNGVTKLDYEYRFSSTQNDGRITQRKDWRSGEEVEYQYDSLQRLSAAATTGAGGWGQSFGYDGFGNLLSETVTKGNAPTLSVNVNPATNRITNTGMSYDANGNLTAMPGLTMTYDVSNRLTSATRDGGGTDNYIYDPAGRRVYRNGYTSFYGVDGSLLGEYSPNWPEGYYALDISVYFGKRLVQKGYNVFASQVYDDRLGSVVYDGTAAPKYFPYGDEPSTTQQNRPKFATYYRDATTALDYAQQRYYASTLGRFTSPDRSGKNESPLNPHTFNRYAYVNGDPVNLNDPSGQSAITQYCIAKGFLNTTDCAGFITANGMQYTGSGLILGSDNFEIDGGSLFQFLQSPRFAEEMAFDARISVIKSQVSGAFSAIGEDGRPQNPQPFSFPIQYLTNLSTIQGTVNALGPTASSPPAQPSTSTGGGVTIQPISGSVTIPVSNPPILGINVSFTAFPGTSNNPCVGIGLAVGAPAVGWSVGPLLLGTDRGEVTARVDPARTRRAIQGWGWSGSAIGSVIGGQLVGSGSNIEAGPVIGTRGPTVSAGYSRCF